MNREAWLQALADKMRPKFAELDAPLGEVRLSCGWPSRGALSSKRRTIGECWGAESSADGARQIFISPLLADAREVAHVVAHELAHAALPHEVGHGPRFAKLAKALGLVGKPTSTEGGPDFYAWCEPLLVELGTYPHARLTATERGRKQSTRLLKASCPRCGYPVRITRKWLDEVGAPICPTDEVQMEVEEG